MICSEGSPDSMASCEDTKSNLTSPDHESSRRKGWYVWELVLDLSPEGDSTKTLKKEIQKLKTENELLGERIRELEEKEHVSVVDISDDEKHFGYEI